MSSTTANPRASGETPSARLRALYWVAIGGIALNASRSLHIRHMEGTWFTDPYWVSFYLSNYRDGYRRRALMGTLCRILFPAGIPIAFINLFAILVLGLAFCLLVHALCKLSLRRSSPRTTLFVFALCASTLTAAFHETLGDLLQFTLVLFSLAGILAVRWLRPASLRLPLALAAVVVCFFFHEASVFLLAPAVPFFLKSRPRLRDFVLPACVLIALLSLSLLWSDAHAHPTYQAILSAHRFQPADPYATPRLQDELQIERQIYFSSHANFANFLWRFPSILVLGFSFWTALTHCLPRPAARRTTQALGCILLGSLPLWVIAFDWGRFLVYAVFLAVVSSAPWRHSLEQEDELAAPGTPTPFPTRFEDLAQNDLLQLGTAFVLLTSPELLTTHLTGISQLDTRSFLVLAAIALLARLTQRPLSSTPTS